MRFGIFIHGLIILGTMAALIRAQPADGDRGHGTLVVRILSPELQPVGDAQVTLRPVPSPFSDEPWARTATTDGEGRVAITLPSGVHELEFQVKGTGYVRPGILWIERDKRVELALPALAPSPEPDAARPEMGDAIAPVPAAVGRAALVPVHGVVRDASGKPVAGATVFAPGLRPVGGYGRDSVMSAVTDADGRFHFETMNGTGLQLVAHTPGSPPAWKHMDAVDLAATTPQTEIILTDQSGGLEVSVSENGRAASGVWVAVTCEWPNRMPQRVGSLAGPLRDILIPAAQTDKDGKARLTGLQPGRYRMATGKDREEAQRRCERGDPESAGPVAAGIGVRAGDLTRYQYEPYPISSSTSLRILRPDGSPVVFKNGDLVCERPWQHPHRSNIRANENGLVRSAFLEPGGLWRYMAICGSGELESEFAPMAQGHLAVSALLPQEPYTVTTSPGLPGSVVVELTNADGTPARGIVALHDFSSLKLIGSTDAGGIVRFPHVRAGEYRAVARIINAAEPTLGGAADPLPRVEDLLNRSAVLPGKFLVTRDTETRIRLQPESVGYVHGFLRPGPGITTTQCRVVSDDLTLSQAAPQARYNPRTGEFVTGPFRPGFGSVSVIVPGAASSGRSFHHPVRIKGGEVTEAEIPVPASDVKRSAPAVRVLHHDGKRPATGAVVLHRSASQYLMAYTVDASGQLEAGAYWHDSLLPRGVAGDIGASPLLAAFIPGVVGPVILPQPAIDAKELTVRLGKPISIKGRVAIGGSARSSVCVMAAPADPTPLRGILTVQATAQADGSFELGGVLEGKYLVQAAMDDIWVSPTVEVEVMADGADSVTLAIPAAAGAVRVLVTDANGDPAAGTAITIDRPAGPLTSILWPRQFATDGAGQAWIPALEAGRHMIRAGSVPATVELRPLPVNEPPTIHLQLPVRTGD